MRRDRSGQKKGRPTSRDQPPVSPEHARIAQWLAKLRFRKKIFGGVRELDVWKRIGELDAMYTQALFAERVRYDALLEQQRQSMLAERCGESADNEERE